MYIETTRHNTYSYLRRTGELIPGIVAEEDYVWLFEPLKPFSLMPEVDTFIIAITEQCNLRCTYCCYSGQYASNRTHSTRSLDRDDIDEIYRFIQQMTTKRPLYIGFYGGEPLTHYDLVQYAIERGLERWDEDVRFSITTNGTLLSEERIDWLVGHNVRLEISIDGTADYHDQHRVDMSGSGSFSRVYQALRYIATGHSKYKNYRLQMILPSVVDLTAIAEEWHHDALLCNIAPSHISSLAPNFAKGVSKKEYETLRDQYLQLLNIYEQHPNWLVLKVYLEECIADWRSRPIVDAGTSVPMSTCMPRNNKLFIDATMQIAVCEKISDNLRIGTVKDGIDWTKANEQVRIYYEKRVHRCARCPAIRMCDLCLTALEFNDEQLDILCHNEREYTKLYMWLFCEMAEKGMIV